MMGHNIHFNPTALRKTKIANNFGLSECNRVKGVIWKIIPEISILLLLIILEDL